MISDYGLEDFSASQSHEKSSGLLSIAAVDVDTLNPIAPLVLEVFQNLIYIPHVDHLEKTETCIPDFNKAVLSARNDVNSIVDSVADFQTVDSAFVSIFIEDKMFAWTVSSDFPLAGTKDDIWLDAVAQAIWKKVKTQQYRS